MDKVKLFVRFLLMLFVLYVVDALSIDDSVDEDEDESPPWSRCPFIRNKLKNGRVKLRSRGRIAKFMCDPGYELAGRRFSTCVRGQWNNPIPVCVSRGCFRPPPVSNARVSETYRGAVLFYECLPGYIIHGGANVYCDGRQWTSEAPTCEVATTSPMLSCDFEDPDLCGWSHDPTHDFDWKRNQFATPSGHVGTGPTSDHTFGPGKGGFYLYMEASSPRKVNDTARLFSPVYPKENSGGCFVFWYNMFGSTTGGLQVYVKPESHVFGELSPTWTEFGDQGNRWFRGNVTVPQFGENFQIVIEGIRGSSYIGDTAIDDVNLRSEDCSLIGNFSHHTSEYLSTSCRGRCMEVNESYPCGCTDECAKPGARCCEDYFEICTQSPESEGTENPEEHSMLITTSLPVKVKTSPKSEETTSIQTATFPFTAVSTPITISFSAKTNGTMSTTADMSSSITRTIPFSSSETSTSKESTSTPSTLSTNLLITSTTPFTTSTKFPMTTKRHSITSTTPSTTPTTTSTTSITTSSTLTMPSTTSTSSSISSASSTTPTTPSTTSATPSAVLTISSTISAVASIISEVPSPTSARPSTTLATPTTTTSRTSNSISTKPSTKFTTSLTASTMPSTTSERPIILPVSYTTSSVKPLSYSTIFLTTPTTPFTTSSVRPSTINPMTSITSSTFITTTASPSSTILPVSKPAVPSYKNSPSTKANQWYTTASSVTAFENHQTRPYNLRPRYSTTPASYRYRTTLSPYRYRTTTSPYRYRTNPPLIYYRLTTQRYYYRVTTKSTTRMFETRSTTRQPSTTKRTFIITPRYTTSSITPSTKLVFKASSSSTTKTISTTTEVSPVAKEAQHTSTTASNDSRSTVTIVSVLFMVGVCIVGGLIFYIRRWKARRQSKLADDSEMRFLYENEVIEFSDSSALDRINFNDPSN